MNWWRRLRRHGEVEQHLDAELCDHLDRQIADYLAAGMSADDARRRARLEFGALDHVKELCRDARGTRWVTDIGQDLRFAARLLVKDRWFTLATIVALAVGIALTSTMFTIVNAMIRGLPIDHPDRFVSIDARDGTGRWRGLGVSPPDFLDFRASMHTVSGLAGFVQATVTFSDNAVSPERAAAAYVSSNTLMLLGEKPVLGRDFLEEDDRPGAAAVVLLGSSVWKARYHADPTLIGGTIRINGIPTTVIGVMPDGFRFPFLSDAWQPLGQRPELSTQRRDARGLRVFGRLADRATTAQAQAEVTAIAARLSRDYPDTNRAFGAVVTGFPGHFAPDPMLIALMSAVGFVLLVACANVAHLVLARLAARSREIATRVTLGATRGRLVRQFLVESALVAGLAGALGFGCSLVGVWLFTRAVADITFPYYIQWTMDGRVLWFVTVVCLGTGGLFGIIPAWHVSKTATRRTLTDGERTTTRGMGRGRWTTGLLMIGELTLTLILLGGAGLMMRSFLAVYRADRVVDATHVLTVPLTLPVQTNHTAAQRTAFYQGVEDRAEAIQGVSSAAFASVVPFMGGPSRQLTIHGRPAAAGDPLPTVSYVTIRGRYFDTLGVHLLRGRTFNETDGEPGHESVIVTQRFVTLFFPHEDPIGQRIRLTTANRAGTDSPPWATIVGVSPSVRQQYLQEIDPVVYVPYRGDAPDMTRDAPDLTLMVRSQSAPDAITRAIRAGLSAVDPDVAFGAIRPLEGVMTQSRWGHRVFGGMLTVFAIIALTLAAVGHYAVTAYAVTQRTHEIGVRMALGAQAGAVVWLFVKRSLWPYAVGLGMGLAGALGMGRLLQAFLIQTSPTDPMTLVGIAALLTGVAAAACVFPARRATRLDPLDALRQP